MPVVDNGSMKRRGRLALGRDALLFVAIAGCAVLVALSATEGLEWYPHRNSTEWVTVARSVIYPYSTVGSDASDVLRQNGIEVTGWQSTTREIQVRRPEFWHARRVLIRSIDKLPNLAVAESPTQCGFPVAHPADSGPIVR
jgi:hypothetical protein